MLSLAKISISGYRSFCSTDIPLADFSILIGRNNSGKSNVLRAIRLLLEGTARDLVANDFHTDGTKPLDTIEIIRDIMIWVTRKGVV
jgi:predicted ATP-dependent endonuclease of OLD family